MTVRRQAWRRLRVAAGLALVAGWATAVVAQTTDEAVRSATPVAAPRSVVGKVTDLPLPRFVSLRTDEGNARRGPSLSHRIDWVFTREGMPLRITDEYGHWRRVEDREGAGGWMHYSLLSGARTVIVTDDLAPLRMAADDGAPVRARAETGVIARLGDCSLDWCHVRTGRQRGWIRKTGLWGVTPDEIRD